MMTKFKKGDVVFLKLDAEAYKCAPMGLRRRNECKMIISKVCKVDNKAYYELHSLNSPAGIPYAVMGEWLTLTKDGTSDD